MTQPILTPTEYSALSNVLEWCWTTLLQEPELCLKDIDYSSASKVISESRNETGISVEYEPTGIDPIKTGECGLGLAEAFEYTLDEPNQENIMLMLKTLMYKLNANPILANGLGNSWETLSPLVNKEEYDRLDDLDNGEASMQTLEGYILEDIALKNKVARLQEHFDGVNEIGFIQVDENLWIDGENSNILP